MKGISRLLCTAVVAFTLPFSASAEVILDIGTTIIGQQTSKENKQINQDVTGSVDVVLDADIGPGTLHLYGEASTNDRATDISANTLVAMSNTDVGTAVDKNGKARFQLSEFAYGFDVDALNISLGVQDLTGFADATAVSNDETAQFLAFPLVNNPAIAFPDYTASLVFNYGDEEEMNWTLLGANGYGMADNPDRKYADLFKFDNVTGTNLKKGLFVLGELRVPAEFGLTVGAWTKTSELQKHLTAGTSKSVAGIYMNVDHDMGNGTLWSFRSGWNNGKSTQEVTAHLSFAAEHAYVDDHVIGFGVAWNQLSSDFKQTLTDGGNPLVAELYYRWQINDYIAISPDVQYWSNANSLKQAPAGSVGGGVWAYALRLQIGGSHQLSN